MLSVGMSVPDQHQIHGKVGMSRSVQNNKCEEKYVNRER